MKSWVGVAALVLSVAGSAADAAVAVIGTGHAAGCFKAAQDAGPLRGSGLLRDSKPLRDSKLLREGLRNCNRALGDDRLAAADRAATYVNRGIVQMHAGNIDAALADYDAAIRTSPDTAEAYVNKGLALQRSGRDAEAVALFSEGIARNPSRPELAYYSRAMAHETLGKTREAYEDYSRAAQLAPDWPEPAEQLQRFKTIRAKTLTA